MTDGNYGKADTNRQPSVTGTEIHVNRDFIGSRDQWFPVADLINNFQPNINLEMYNNTAPSYPPGYNNAYQYQYPYGYPATYGYQNAPPGPPAEAAYQHQVGGWTQAPTAQAMQHGYPPIPHQPAPTPNQDQKLEVVHEMQQQKATLTKQREDYVKKAMVLRRELDDMKQQKQELSSGDMSEREMRFVFKENERLQDEINGKLKAILNVIEMLSSIIKDGKKIGDLEAQLGEKEANFEAVSLTPQREVETDANGRQQSVSRGDREKYESEVDNNQRFSYVYYDTGLHWCRACDKFPDTAKELLQHLHSNHHQDKAKENEVDTTPWHKLPLEPLLPSFDDAPKKRIPIKGLQFFISAPSWYCKLCDVWIGDLHCASHHLKSLTHFQNYEIFVKQNPQWETEWIKDREIAMTRNINQAADSSGSEQKSGKKRSRRQSTESFLKEKKKKKRSKKKKKKDSSDSSSSSSSSSESSSDEDEKEDRGKSIRVAMRNMQQVKSIMDEDMSKWTILEKLVQDVRKKDGEKKEKGPSKGEDELINQWMTVTNPVPEKEKNLLEGLKDRMKAKQDIEKAKVAELEKRRKDKEKEEQEASEKKRKQAREESEKAEKERDRKKKEELNRVWDKDRGNVRFKPGRDNVRKQKQDSDEENRSRRDRHYRRGSREKERSPQFKSRRSIDRMYRASSRESSRDRDEPSRKKPHGPPSYKKLPFIGRMPLFKKKMGQKDSDKEKELKEEVYEPTRKTRFESGNLTRAYIPRPEVVCFPMLSSIPPISAPPEPTAVEEVAYPTPMPSQEYQTPLPKPPVAPKLSSKKKSSLAAPPPPPPLDNHHKDDENDDMDLVPTIESTFYQMYEESGFETLPHPPLEPPPLPPDDDLALLGICADDMAAQSF
ncbi:zinc finger matrin-type protein CG9776 isoform X1 [Dendroctonus ponderosae]|uniref:zinc finger matrin-type protein CG9776 isoform X1 n=2 Tax=Dendroctonus ponderosae TaxID=77166 RepID=UPI002035460B|nr:zinc finger matrin-type protein CG9776 isoform X1 [Dendroctonus ponderosae]KAH1026575.1 hypothetical protein HUJ05_000217 [Dendroctonus ponderosae]